MDAAPGKRDLQILRDLARRRAEYAADPVNASRRRQWRDRNGLRRGKPMTWITEIPWHEIEKGVDALRPRISEPPLRQIEQSLRRKLWRWECLHVDTVLDPEVRAPTFVRGLGDVGIREDADLIPGPPGSVGSRRYRPVVRDLEDVRRIRDPVIRIDEDATRAWLDLLGEVYDGISPVVRRGVSIYGFTPWDDLVRWTGVERALLDMVDRPDFLHALVGRLTEAHLAQLHQLTELDVLASNNLAARTGSGAYGLTDELPGPEAEPVSPEQNWGFATSQILGDVSPAMHEEFSIRYEARWLASFGLGYYGCCESLHSKMGLLESIPRLRKVSISPRCNVGKAAVASGGRYVFSHKPNPAHLAGDDWQPEVVRADLHRRLEETQGIPCEIVLKDISTVRGRAERVIEFTRIMSEVAEEFAP